MSIYGEILTAVRDRIEEEYGFPPVRIRRRWNIDIDDSKPLIVVVPDKDEIVDVAMDGDGVPILEVEYGVWVIYADTNEILLDGDIDDYLEARERLRQLLFIPDIIPDSFDVDMKLHPPFEPKGLPNGHDYSPILVKYRVTEKANG